MRTYLYLNGERVAVNNLYNTNHGQYYYGSDILGSVKFVTGQGGQEVRRIEYDVFGGIYKGNSPYGLETGYTGKPYDSVTGLSDYGFRDYSPAYARFITEDPIRDGENWFAYVGNNPVNWVDPWGLDILNVNPVAQKQDKNSASQMSLGGGQIHEKWGYKSTIRNYGCVYTSQVNASNAANHYFNTGRTTNFIEYNTVETFGADQLIDDVERKAFQEKSTGLIVKVYRVDNNRASIDKIRALQADNSKVVAIEARVRGGGHSININGITIENGSEILNYFETAGYFEDADTKAGKRYGLKDITGIRVMEYEKKTEYKKNK